MKSKYLFFGPIARVVVYSAVIALCIMRVDEDVAGRAMLLIPAALLTLAALEGMRRWERTAPHYSIYAAVADFALAALVVLWLDPAMILLFGLVIVADGVLGGWLIAFMLGVGAIAVDILLDFVRSTGQGLSGDTGIRIAFWFLLSGIATILAWQRESERRARIELEKSVQVRSDRLSMLSHEIRTPLTLMRASLELLFDESAGPLKAQQRTFMQTIYQNEERIATLAQNLLTQARLESGVFSPKTQPVDLRRIVRLVLNDMRILIEQRNQQIRTYYPQVLPLVPADPGLIRQVLINLIQNGSRHTSEGGLIVVSIAQNDYALLISVTDDGAGMGLEHRRRLFKRFSTSEANSREGTGLGLVIVKQIVEWHGGRVYVDTSLGRGTSFYFTLPFDKDWERGKL